MVRCPDAANDAPTNLSIIGFESEDIPLKLTDSLALRRKKENLRLYAIATCITSVILNLILCILSFVFAKLRHSPATFAFAADCILDLLSSLVVIWRYFGSPYRTLSLSREIKACISLGILFIVAGVGVIGEGAYFLVVKEVPKWNTVLVVLAAVGFVVCVLLGIAKYVLCKKMESKSLYLDALNSLLSALFALVIIISDVVYLKNKNVWYLDPVLSIVFSCPLIAFGIRTIILHSSRGGYESGENGF
ncbi:transmembrane protein 163-like isoform X2 [Uloborus diversus]|uniref:transmembrane protein 163-like isoform X2 n=1 Tax=Uloborus diversus TaxID=327109 RepID=UPI00240905FF|nr:transmembrane protein 163-like isoform X2 [Uloborus diversus]XP_054709610.1 transmembrane protein 163-like isoform X2 [Uloborus diversus]XP_054709611.1 transmembrane protein 163-like isoform X2 [Uloborus diversus]